MKYDPTKHHRRSIRLKGYDYSQVGAYFVTLCTENRESLFGRVDDDEMCVNDFGMIATEFWDQIPHRFPGVELDEFVVMPNHVHGIIVITENPAGAIWVGANPVGAIHESPLQTQRRKMLLSKIIGYFKMNTAKRINAARDTAGTQVWQRDYYEHIVRDEHELSRLREYIANNPARWAEDEENVFVQRQANG